MSNSSSSSSSSGGIGFVGLLTIVFIILKLTETTIVATWSWWWVLSPLWISFGFWVIVAVIMYLIAKNL